MARGAPPVFLAHARYRQRRLRDGLWLMPVLGALLFGVPILWPQGEDAATATLQGTANSAALLYLFAVWAGLIMLGAYLSARLRRDEDDDAPLPDGGAGHHEDRIAEAPAETGRDPAATQPAAMPSDR